ncbi:MAG: hypothetical protein ACO32I_07535, partial [Candidatus Limnocylindrus sp.]
MKALHTRSEKKRSVEMHSAGASVGVSPQPIDAAKATSRHERRAARKAKVDLISTSASWGVALP